MRRMGIMERGPAPTINLLVQQIASLDLTFALVLDNHRCSSPWLASQEHLQNSKSHCCVTTTLVSAGRLGCSRQASEHVGGKETTGNPHSRNVAAARHGRRQRSAFGVGKPLSGFHWRGFKLREASGGGYLVLDMSHHPHAACRGAMERW